MNQRFFSLEHFSRLLSFDPLSYNRNNWKDKGFKLFRNPNWGASSSLNPTEGGSRENYLF